MEERPRHASVVTARLIIFSKRSRGSYHRLEYLLDIMAAYRESLSLFLSLLELFVVMFIELI